MKDIDWTGILRAIVECEKKQNYEGKYGARERWSLDMKLPDSTVESLDAYMRAHGENEKTLAGLLPGVYSVTGEHWVFTHKRAPVIGVLLFFLYMLVFAGLANAGDVWLALLLLLVPLGVWFLRSHRQRRLRGARKQEGSVESRLDKMCEISRMSGLAVNKITLPVFLLLALPLAFFSVMPQLIPYWEADSKLSSGQYQEAAKSFAAIKGFRDSGEKAAKAWIAYGDGLKEKGRVSDALKAYEQAGKEGRDKANALRYEQGEARLAEGDFDAAANWFSEAGDYRDAKERILALRYEEAEQLLSQGNEDGAISAFRQAGNYRDAKDRISALYYQRAEALLAAGDEDGAAAAFKTAGDYLDAPQRWDGIFRARAESCRAQNRWQEAEDLFAVLEDTEQIRLTRYLHALSEDSAGNTQSAFLILNSIPDYAPEGRPSVPELLQEERFAGLRMTEWMIPGSVVVLGRYEQDNRTNNGPEPLEWIVLDSDGQRSLLITRYIIDVSHNGSSTFTQTWEKTSHRAWLNKTFLNAAFNEAEQAALLTVTNLNGVETSDPKNGVDGGGPTEDRVFALSYQEASRYLTEGLLKADVTAYADAQDVKSWGGKGNYYYFLRSFTRIGNGNVYAWTVEADKFTPSRLDLYDFLGVGARPSVWVDAAAAAALGQ